MLLEEALAGGGTDGRGELSPHDAALALLSFLRDELPAGGTGAERRFVGLFPLIADRVFGEWRGDGASPSSSSPSSPTAAGMARVPDYIHGEGGWLGLRSPPSATRAAQSRGRPGGGGGGGAPPSPSSMRSQSYASQQHSLEDDPIVRLLRASPAPPMTGDDDDDEHDGDVVGRGVGGRRRHYAPPTLIDAMTAESLRRPDALFGFPLGALSSVVPSLVEGWGACLGGRDEKTGGGRGVVAGGGENNAARILTILLAPPRDQSGLRAHFFQQQQQQLRVSSSTPTGPSRGSSGPCLELTMLEYYLLLFVRFPLSNSTWTESDGGRPSSGGPTSATRAVVASPCYGWRAYRHLLAGYLDSYLPQGRDHVGGGNAGRRRRFASPGADDAAAAAATTTTSPSPPPSSFAHFRDGASELFLRLVIGLWIDGPNVAPTTIDAVYRRRRARAGAIRSSRGDGDDDDPSTLRDSLELARPVAVDVIPPPSQVMDGVLALVQHLVSDNFLVELAHGASGALQRRQREEREGERGDVGEGANDGAAGLDEVPWPLPPALTVVQPSAYNYIRLGLACGAIHDRSSMFHGALETWLAWLEPWNYVMKRRAPVANRTTGGGDGGLGPGGSAGGFLRNAAATVSSRRRVEYHPTYRQPRPTSPSYYDPRWESYVVCNAHYYTAPLAIFLRRARELDFSSTVEYPRSLALVQRVLRIYSKDVVNVLNGVLNSRRADALTASLFERHGLNMGAYCPPMNWKLIDCQLDVTNLLEEIYGQYQKRRTAMDFLERMEDKLSALFEGKMGGEEAALEKILTQVRYLVQLPLDYQVLPDEPKISRGLWRLFGSGAKDAPTNCSDDMSLPVRGPDGTLTDLGRQQLRAGLCKCDPYLTYIGDPMLSRVKSYEIPALVELTVWISNYLNNRLLLTAPPLSPGMDVDDDDLLMKRYREMKQYEEVKIRINLRFLANRRTLAALLVFCFALSCGRPSMTRPPSSLLRLLSHTVTESTSRRGIASAGGRSAPRQTVGDVRGGARHSRGARRIR